MRLLAVSSVAVLALAAPASGQEELCRELGARCLCSETLDPAEPYRVPPSTHFDPPSSPSGKKECAPDGRSLYLREGRSVDPVAKGVPFPWPNRVRHVLEVRVAGTSYLSMRDTDLANQTLCTRHYRRFGPRMPDSLTRAKLKTWRLRPGKKARGPGAMNVQASFGGNPTRPQINWVDKVWGIDRTLAGSGTPMTLAVHKASWVRYESCVDHDADGVLHVRARLTRLDDGAVQWIGPEDSCPGELDCVRHPGASHRNSWLIEFYTQGLNDPGAPCDPRATPCHQYVGYAIQALATPADPDFWIGPAREVEPPRLSGRR